MPVVSRMTRDTGTRSSERAAGGAREARKAMAQEGGWRWCYRCEGVFIPGRRGNGVCPAGGAHDMSRSGYITILYDVQGPNLQDRWRWCFRCYGLFFAGHQTYGVCPTGGAHDPSRSANYSLDHGQAGAGQQGGWRWCSKCEGLFYGGHQTTGVCPAGHGHNPGRTNYKLTVS